MSDSGSSSSAGPLPSWLSVALAEDSDPMKQHIANATSTGDSDAWVLIVDTIILSLTIIGASSILGSMAWREYRGRSATTRMRVVQSLVMSDLILGIVGVIGAGLKFDDLLIKNTVSCDGLGVMLVAVLFSQHLWTLALASTTYMILIHPLHALTMWLEKKWFYLWAMVWTIAFGAAVLGFELYGYAPSGGICFYPDMAGLYGELMQFLPRAIVMICIAILYAKLYVFLRRPDKIRAEYSGSQRTDGNAFSVPQPGNRFASWIKRKSSTPEAPQDVKEKAENQETPRIEEGPPSPRQNEVIPPWEKIDLPVFQVDGQRFGGPSTPSASTPLWSNWKGMAAKESKKRPSTSSASRSPISPQSTRIARFGSVTSADGSGSSRPPSPLNVMPPRLETIPADSDTNGTSPGTITSYFPSARRRSGELSGSLPNPYTERRRKPSTLSAIEPNSAQFNHDTSLESYARRPSAATQHSRQSSANTPSNMGLLPAPQPSLSERSDVEQGDTDPDHPDKEFDLMHMLASTAPVRGVDDRFVPQEGDIELVEESMSSYLNRKTALLMLWFPLGYMILFSVSLIRIIYDFAGNPPTGLRAVSRWFIFAQGILDALIYGFVEWHTKRAVRRRVRRGALSPSGSQSRTLDMTSQSRNLASALRNIGRRSQTSSQLNPTASANLGTHGGVHRQPGTVSFGRVGEEPGTRSILQALETEPFPGFPGVVGGVGERGRSPREGSVPSSTTMAVSLREGNEGKDATKEKGWTEN